ncbi:AAA family ATPase [Flavobacterium sp. J27]|uniref:AAA family ATPase n=1 Tax=Flavobacterium sp. J27 TaxID=2060419 RepID=UPI0010323B76|nr:AAA family ATPase [Flavobacterium sp. J27]
MQCIMFIGIPASGKSSFYKENFFNSHIRVSLDLLNTRNKETKLIEYCFTTQSQFVIDNTNVSKEERAKYITLLKEKKYKIIAYYFECSLKDALERNGHRKEKISEIGVKAKYNQLELPQLNEGFDEMYKVSLNNDFFKIDNYEI